MMKTPSALLRLIKLKMLSLIRSVGYKGYSLIWLLWNRFFPMCCRLFTNVIQKLNWWNDGGSATEDLEHEPITVSPQNVEEGSPIERSTGYGSEQQRMVEENPGDLTEDELYCDYDSTWESEPGQENTRPGQENTRPGRNTRRSRRTSALPGYLYDKFSRFERAAIDMWNYRHDYPNKNMNHYSREPEPEPFNKPNLEFYLGKAHCLPDRLYINDIHNYWDRKYTTLENVHTYIQWLFPLQEPGMNSQAWTLTKQEIKDFCNSDIAKQNLLKSYKLMLDFYGIRLIDEQTGELARAKNWEERFYNLNSHTHNSLRITRILKCLGTLGYPHYQAPLVQFFLNETLVLEELPNVKESVLNYFLFAVLDKRARKDLLKFAYINYSPREEFVWCPKKIQMSSWMNDAWN